MKRAIVVGAGGHGRSVAEALRLTGELELIGFLDDLSTQPVLGLPVLGPATGMSAFRHRADALIIAIGKNALRKELHQKALDAGFMLPPIIHPRAYLSPSARLEAGCAVMAGAVVGTEAVLGVGVIVNSGAIVDHHCRVGDFAHLGVGACMAGGSMLGAGAWMQAGSALAYSVQVGDGEVLAPGEARVARDS
jgi:sugar O-acyltransferase (sialic acid O-acetyltransferase NeuD family)